MYITVNNIQLAYSEAGTGQPVLFVHGYPLNRRMWQPQLVELSKTCRVITLDLRGHGESQTVPGPYTVDLLADDLHGFIEALQLREPVVLGCLSMGGYVTFAFYRKYPQRVAGLVLTSTRAAPDSPDVRESRTKTIATIQTQGMAAVAESMAPRLLAPGQASANPALLEQVRSIMLETSPEGAMGDLIAMRERPDSTPTLSQITCPALVVHGAEDQVVSVSEAQAMYSAIRASAPVAEIQVLQGAGHMPNLEHPQVYNQHVGAFLRRIV